MTNDELAEQRRTGRIKNDKQLKKLGKTDEDIAEINKKMKDAATKSNKIPDKIGRDTRGGHDPNRVMDSGEGSKQALRIAQENLARHPNDPNAQQELRDAQRQVEEFESRKRDVDTERRRQAREGE